MTIPFPVRKTCRALAMMLAGAPSACSAPYDEEHSRFDTHVDEVHVLAQACLPDRTLQTRMMTVDMARIPPNLRDGSFPGFTEAEIAAGDHDVRIVVDDGSASAWTKDWVAGGVDLNRGRIVSDGIENLRLIGATDTRQPVFEVLSHRQDTILALHMFAYPVGAAPKSHFEQYWFRVPANLSRTTFTPWLAPSRDKDSGPVIPKSLFAAEPPVARTEPPIPAYAPRMRFKLQSNFEYQHQLVQSDPARTAAIFTFDPQRNLPQSSIPAILPIAHGVIPDC